MGYKKFSFFKELEGIFKKKKYKNSSFILYFCRGGLVAFSFAGELSIKEFFTNAETWKYLFWNCIFLNFMHPSLPGCFDGKFAAVNGALWTIKIEIAFYVVLPILIWFFKKMKSLKQLKMKQKKMKKSKKIQKKQKEKIRKKSLKQLKMKQVKIRKKSFAFAKTTCKSISGLC